MKLSNFANYMGMTTDPKSLRVATVSVTVPFLWIFSRTIHGVAIVRPAGSLCWQFLDPSRPLGPIDDERWSVTGKPVVRTPDFQAEQLEREFVAAHYGKGNATYIALRHVGKGSGVPKGVVRGAADDSNEFSDSAGPTTLVAPIKSPPKTK